MIIESQKRRIAEKNAYLIMQKEIKNWAHQKNRRETNLRAMTERMRLPRLPANAVMLKPRGQTALNKKKLFRDEEHFLEIESSLASSQSDDSQNAEMLPKMGDMDLMHSQTLDNLPQLAQQKSELFFLSQVDDDKVIRPKNKLAREKRNERMSRNKSHIQPSNRKLDASPRFEDLADTIHEQVTDSQDSEEVTLKTNFIEERKQSLIRKSKRLKHKDQLAKSNQNFKVQKAKGETQTANQTIRSGSNKLNLSVSLPQLQLPVIDPELIRMFPEVTLSAQKPPAGFEASDDQIQIQGWN